MYQQSPAFLDRIYYIMAERAKHEEAQRKKEERERRNKSPSATRRPSMGGRGKR